MLFVFAGREVTVPDVGGLTVDQARAELSRTGLLLETSSERYDDRVAAGIVLAQDPAAGETLKKERKVRVSVSLGALQVEIPDVRGQTTRSAQVALQKEGLKVGHISHTHDARVPPDVVIAQDPLDAPVHPSDAPAPEPGAVPVDPELRPRLFDGRVSLLVSRGRQEPSFVMPDLQGWRFDEVMSFARRAGARVGAVRRERASGVARGRVIRQSPQAGYPLSRSDMINLVMSE
ncbi:MAG TPA: PASTA domain-containing protein [Candidatus Polarisedimenticolia bacterium]|nr:PASTA domain-containing protein [Candidatus Polarisedimenticolia bacterium]